MHASPDIADRATQRRQRAGAPGAGLLNPIPLAAVGVLVLNDHVLKAAYGAGWTGKLSDFAGLVFFPLLLQAVIEVAQSSVSASWRRSPGVLVACAAATAIVFAAINTFAPAAELYRHGLGVLQWPFRALLAAAAGATVPGLAPVQHTLDPTDLIALPFAGLAVWLGARRPAQEIP